MSCDLHGQFSNCLTCCELGGQLSSCKYVFCGMQSGCSTIHSSIPVFCLIKLWYIYRLNCSDASGNIFIYCIMNHRIFNYYTPLTTIFSKKMDCLTIRRLKLLRLTSNKYPTGPIIPPVCNLQQRRSCLMA